MRGKVLQRSVRKLHSGITPAYAGKSLKSARLFQLCEDHPRLCGEKSTDKRPFRKSSGSPPPMRGKGSSDRTVPCRCRITPAYAGKSFDLSRSFWLYRDHPRLCGEKPKMSTMTQPIAGSPPPMRGKVPSVPCVPAEEGITPAYAGKSCTLQPSFGRSGDHPRLCGEKRTLSVDGTRLWGSPPPMRGKANGNYTRKGDARITPAYAGKRHISHRRPRKR